MKIKDFYQTLSNGHEVFDFGKVAAKGFPINIVITERGAKGKTFNIKEHLRKEFMKDGRPSIFMVNTKTLAEKTKADFLLDIAKPLCRKEIGKVATNFWDRCTWQGSVLKNNAWLMYQGQRFIKIMGLSDAEKMKGTRIDWANIVWEEFNQDWTRIQDPLSKLDSLLNTAQDPVLHHGQKQQYKLWVFGNFKTLNNMFLYKLGVVSINRQITSHYMPNKQPHVLTIVPKYTKDDIAKIEKENTNNFVYHTSKMLGLVGHSFYNLNVLDIVNNIIKIDPQNDYDPDIESHNKGRYQIDGPNFNNCDFQVYHNKIYYNFWYIAYPEHPYKHYVEITGEKHEFYKPVDLFVFHKRDIIEGANLNLLIKEQAFLKFLQSEIAFQSVVARELFVSSIKS